MDTLTVDHAVRDVSAVCPRTVRDGSVRSGGVGGVYEHRAEHPARGSAFAERTTAMTAPRAPRRRDRCRISDDPLLMEAPSLVFSSAQQAFRFLVTGPAPLVLDGHLFAGLPARIVDLRELARLLPATSHSTQDAVWADLVVRAQTGSSAWTVGAVGVALPSLVKIACELCTGYSGDVEDVDNEVLAGFCRKLRSLDPDAGRIFARLYWAARRDGAKLRNSESDYAAHVRPSKPQPVEPPPPAEHPDLMLARAVRDGAISEWEARVIGTTRLESAETSDSLNGLATRFGLSRHQLYRTRARAEQRLAQYLADEEI